LKTERRSVVCDRLNTNMIFAFGNNNIGKCKFAL